MEQVPETVAVSSYQVFINHRGPDVKKTLASLIYHRLKSYGLSVFLDRNELRTGDTVSPAILGAIHSASVHVAIFSEHYAESSWCLDELYWILRSHHKRNTKIIPVFSSVEPSDLRRIESGPYAGAFEKHEHKRGVAMEDLLKWKKALNEASHISGLLFNKDKSDLGEILERIVEIVLKEVLDREVLEVAKYPVGLEQAAEDFQNEMMKHSHSNATKIVGIAGMGGVGKSTLAKHLYNLKRHDFSRSSILCEVRNMGLLSLQKQLFVDLLGSNDLQFISSVSQGRRNLQDRLPRLSPVFIVLDDVDHPDQIESLLDVDAVASGSLILITSRDKELLRCSSTKTVVYDVKPLQKRHARELFCRHAFSQSKPSEELEDLVEEFLKFCGGLPLSLKVLGGLFVRRCDKDYWKRQLQKLSTKLPFEIINSLKVSYEALDPEEKEVFLDIGCFLVGEEKELAIQVLEGLHDNSRIGDYLESLHKKCLVDFRYDVQSENEIECRKGENPNLECKYWRCKLTMHDQLRGLARHIAREEFGKNSPRNPLRISSLKDIKEMRKLQDGSSLQIRGIRYSIDDISPCFNMYSIRAEGVRIIVVERYIEELFFNFCITSGELVWLRLRSSPQTNPVQFHVSNPVRSISLRRLRVLEIQMSGDAVDYVFQNLDHDLPHLNVLNIHYTVPETNNGSGFFESSHQTSSRKRKSSQQISSRFFNCLRNWGTGIKTLTKLVLKNIGFLQSLPIDFSQLRNLRHLDLSGCSELTELPNTFSELLQLQYLALQGCINLSMPLDILGEISTLQYVDFQDCYRLKCLPERIPYQRHLRYLNLVGTRLLQLPDNLEKLENLEQIRIGCPELENIPLTVANLRSLTELFLLQCSSLQQIITEGIAAPKIKILVIDGCPIDNFSFQDQGNLDFENIHLTLGMRLLRDLTLSNTSIAEICIPEGVYPSLETIDISENTRLMSVNGLPSAALVSLNLQNCRELKTLTSLSKLKSLKCLNINGCCNLKTLNMEGLASLEEFKAEGCWELQRIEGLSLPERLNCLHISTDNTVFWEDIDEFLRLPNHQEPLTAIFSGRVDNDKIFGKGDMLRITDKFNLQMHDIVSSERYCYQRLENLHAHSAILICFITNDAKSQRFSVRFEPPTYGVPSLEYSTVSGDRGGRGVHVFMWTEGSRLFKEYSVFSEFFVALSHDSRHPVSLSQGCSSSNVGCSSSNVEDRGRGWIIMVNKKLDVSKVCRELILKA